VPFWRIFACHCTTWVRETNLVAAIGAVTRRNISRDFHLAQALSWPLARSRMQTGTSRDGTLTLRKKHRRGHRSAVNKLLGHTLMTRFAEKSVAEKKSIELPFDDTLPTAREMGTESAADELCWYHARVNLAKLESWRTCRQSSLTWFKTCFWGKTEFRRPSSRCSSARRSLVDIRCV